MNKKINYKGTNLEKLYELALLGAYFATEKNDNGVTVINSLHKQLYIKTVLLTRLLDVIELDENKIILIEQFNNSKFNINSIEGNGKKRLIADFEVFKEMLNEEIRNIVYVNNDFINRFNETITTEMTPENIEKLKQQKDDILNKLAEIRQ